MKIVKKAEFMKLPLGTVWSEIGAFDWQIKTGMRMGALALIGEDNIMRDLEWDCDYEVDYDNDSEFLILEPEEIDKIIERLKTARNQLKANKE